MTDDIQHGRPLPVDATARSASPESNQVSSPARTVHPCISVLSSLTMLPPMVSHWQDHRLGGEPCEAGDAFVIAPDGSQAGLVWEASDKPYFQEIMPVETGRWSVWGVGFRLPMNSRENARRNLESVLPELKLRWRSGSRGSIHRTAEKFQTRCALLWSLIIEDSYSTPASFWNQSAPNVHSITPSTECGFIGSLLTYCCGCNSCGCAVPVGDESNLFEGYQNPTRICR